MDMRFFPSITNVREYCTQKKISICGIEILPESRPIYEMPFRGDTLFMLGNEGSGLNSNQIAICDHFVYIPQYTDKTASLNVAIAGSIIFYQFAQYARYPEAGREGQKYNTGEYKVADQNKRILMNEDNTESAMADELRE